jgi:hypothetical protein
MTWDLYRQRVREGLHLEKAYVGAHWHVFRLSVLQNFAGLKWAQGRPPVRFVLDEIHDGVHDPRRSQR